MLRDKISSLISYAHAVAINGAIKDPAYVEMFIAKTEIIKMIEEDFMSKNPEEMTDEYTDYIKTLKLKSIGIKKGECFYRARTGCEVLKGSVDGYNRDFLVPYHGIDICAPPPMMACGARFNREGNSYLYLADDIDTCVAEIHAQIDQICSVGEFKLLEDAEFIDLREKGDLETSIFVELLTQPINTKNLNRYNITRFLAEILKNINPNGIIFKSVQSSGNNIVCFKKKLFVPIEFSQRLFKVKEIKYITKEIDSAVDEYAKRKANSYGSIISINDEIEDANQRKFDYLNEWIDCKRETLKSN